MVKTKKRNEDLKPIVLGDSIKIEGFVEIRNGETIIRANNAFVQSMLIHIMNALSVDTIYCGDGTRWYGPINTPNMYLGTDTTTPTVYNTTALTSPIGGAPGTAPNTIIGSTSNPSNGVFQMVITATWNSGTVSGTVGEMALYLNLTTPIQAFGWDKGLGNLLGSVLLASRLSVADGSFSSFLIDNTKPLVVTWTIRVSFS